jgi:hypothetical protein
VAEFLNDTFTEGSDTALASHTADSGGAWAQHPNFTTNTMTVVASEDRVKGNSTSGTAFYYNNETPGSAEYDVEATFRVTTAGDSQSHPGLLARLATGASTFYQMYYAGDGTPGPVQLQKVVAGVATTLATAAFTPATNTDYQFKLEIRDAAKKVYIDGVEVISSADNAITDAGFVGIRSRANGRIDNLTATDTTGGTDTVTTASTTHATVSDAATLAQTHLLVAIDATQAHTADEASFVQTVTLVVDGTTHGHDAAGATLTQTHVLVGDSATHETTADNATFAAAGELVVADATHAVDSGTATFAQTHAVVAADASHEHTAAAATLAQTHAIVADSPTHGHAADATAFVSGLLLVVQDTAHGQTADTTSFVQTHLLVGIDAEQGHSAGEDTLAQLHALVAANATHGNTPDQVDLDSLVPGPSTLNTATLDARRPGVTFDVTTGRSVSV